MYSSWRLKNAVATALNVDLLSPRLQNVNSTTRTKKYLKVLKYDVIVSWCYVGRFIRVPKYSDLDVDVLHSRQFVHERSRIRRFVNMMMCIFEGG